MSCSSEMVTSTTSLHNTKITALESSLHKNISEVFRDLVRDYEELDECRKRLITQKEKCERKNCNSSEELKKIIESKNNIIQLVASTLTKLYETKNFNFLNEVFKILCGDTTVTIPKLEPFDDDKDKIANINIKTEVLTPKKGLLNSIADELVKDESVSEIEGTPTGRLSPIIQTRKARNGCSANLADLREKKKCPDNWPAPDGKAVKLTFPTPTKNKPVRLRQGRLNLVKQKRNTIVDLTSSPELMTVKKCSQNDSNVQMAELGDSKKKPSGAQHRKRKLEKEEKNKKLTSPIDSFDLPLVKKESTDNDDTILPSPTSGPNNYMAQYKTTSFNSPVKKSSLCVKSKTEVLTPLENNNLENTPTKNVSGGNNVNIEDSFNILRPARYKSTLYISPVKKSLLCLKSNPIKNNNLENTPTKNALVEDSVNLLKPVRCLKMLDENTPIKVSPVEDDETYCDIASSLSILNAETPEQKLGHVERQKPVSPAKQPLAENKNITNVPEDSDASMSLLRREPKPKVSPTEDKTKRPITLSCKRPPAPVEPLYKEPAPRTKAEKRKLPGWNCDECKNFYDELYADDPEMLAAKMAECSKHRGRNNPARPKTPPGFWNPRWSVPTDTEEFNKRNNAN